MRASTGPCFISNSAKLSFRSSLAPDAASRRIAAACCSSVNCTRIAGLASQQAIDLVRDRLRWSGAFLESSGVASSASING